MVLVLVLQEMDLMLLDREEMVPELRREMVLVLEEMHLVLRLEMELDRRHQRSALDLVEMVLDLERQ